MATPRSRHRGSIGIVAAGLALGLVAACGGGGSASPDEPLQFFLSGDANQVPGQMDKNCTPGGSCTIFNGDQADWHRKGRTAIKIRVFVQEGTGNLVVVEDGFCQCSFGLAPIRTNRDHSVLNP